MLKRIFLACVAGVFAGTAATIFLIALKAATTYRELHPVIIYALPFMGLLIGWVYHTYGKDSEPGTNLIMDEIHKPQQRLPLKMAPMILLSTVATHLFGGSAGREGTVVQMGASLADQLSRGLSPERRRALLQAGAGAGFGAAIGAPIAGVLFGMEFIRARSNAWLECLVASLFAFLVTLLLHAPHTHYPPVFAPLFDIKLLLYTAGAGLAFGFTARFFIYLTHLVEIVQKKLVKFPPLKPFLAGVLLVILYTAFHTTRYAGLGLPIIQQGLTDPSPWYDPLLKALFTALTIGSGFKGGEFIPLVFIGTTLGSALGSPILAAVGFAAVFGAAANTPLACAVMAMEIFGWSMAPYALLGGYIAYFVSGTHGIYKTQPRSRQFFLLGSSFKLR